MITHMFSESDFAAEEIQEAIQDVIKATTDAHENVIKTTVAPQAGKHCETFGKDPSCYENKEIIINCREGKYQTRLTKEDK